MGNVLGEAMRIQSYPNHTKAAAFRGPAIHKDQEVNEAISTRKLRPAMIPTVRIVLASLSIGAIHQNSGRAEAACFLNLPYFSDETRGYVDGVYVRAKAQLRGYIFSAANNEDTWALGSVMPSCLHGYIESKSNSRINQLSWETWLYVNDDEEENWGSSRRNCRKGGAKSDFELYYLQRTGIYSIKIKGYHVWIENGDRLDRRTEVRSGPL